MTTDTAIGSLLACIYDAATDSARWPDAITMIRRSLGCEASLLFHRDSTLSMRYCEFAALSGWTADHAQLYTDYYGSRDTRSLAVLGMPTGRAYVDDRTLPFAAIERTEIFQDFFRVAGLGRAMGVTLFADSGRHSMLSLHRAYGPGGFSDDEVNLLETLLPHLVRALQMQRQMQRAEERARGLALTLDHFALPVFLVDAGSDLRHMNAAAAELLAEPDSPLRVTANRLFARDSSRAEALRASVAAAIALARGQGAPATEILHLPRRHADGTLALLIAPLRDPGGGGLAIVFASDPMRAPLPDIALLMRQFGLTLAEAAVAGAIGNGETLGSIADSRRVSLETIRTLLKRAFQKTDTRSQVQLVGRLARSLAALRRDPH